MKCVESPRTELTEQADVALNTIPFEIRRRGQKTLKTELRWFEEAILATCVRQPRARSPLSAQCLFNPRVIDFDRKLLPTPALFNISSDVDEMLELGAGSTPVRGR